MRNYEKLKKIIQYLDDRHTGYQLEYRRQDGYFWLKFDIADTNFGAWLNAPLDEILLSLEDARREACRAYYGHDPSPAQLIEG